MTTELSGLVEDSRVAFGRRIVSRTPFDTLRMVTIAAGIGSAALFVIAGLRFGLQMYADGSLFSYAVAVRDAWAFHCHNISGRLFVYLYAFAPAELYVQLTQDPAGGVALYGFLFFAAQFLGLLATYAADRSEGRILFGYACVSTACLCPMVFGFPTEVWVMHALVWPALAVCHYARQSRAASVLILALMLALVLTHAGALISAVAILMTLALRGVRHPAFRRAAVAFGIALAIWILVKLTLRPDAYVAGVLVTAAMHVFDPSILTGSLMLILYCALGGYVLAFVVLRRWSPQRAHVYAALLVAAGLAAYWLRFDHVLHAANRYYLRTVLLLATPAFGMLAAVHAISAEGDMSPAIPLLSRLMETLTGETMARAATGALALVMLIHSVETDKFVTAWVDYKAAVRSLATGTASDASLGDPRFVSSARLGPELNRTSWFSTTPFLSVLVAPKLVPTRLVVDPSANYFWLSCETATESAQSRRAAPVLSRDLIRSYSCLHRKRRR